MGTEQRLATSCTPSLKPEMESFLRNHPHLLTALGLSCKISTEHQNIISHDEAKPQPDLDNVHTSQTAEEPELSQSSKKSTGVPQETTSESSSDDDADANNNPRMPSHDINNIGSTKSIVQPVIRPLIKL